MKAKIALLTILLAGVFFLPSVARADDDDDDGDFFDHILGGSVTIGTEYGDVTVVFDHDRGGYYGDYPDHRRRSRGGRSPYTGAPEPTYGGSRTRYASHDRYSGGRSPYTGAPEPTYGGRRREPAATRGPAILQDPFPRTPRSGVPEDDKRKKALEKTLERLDSTESSERMAALDTLGGFTLSGEDEEALERLEESVKEDPAQEVRLKAVEILGSVKSEKVLPVLERAGSKDPSEEVRQEARRAYQRVEVLLLRQKIAEFSLTMRTGDKDERLDALDDLEEIPQSVSKRILLSCAASDPEPEVREKAVKKLGDILEKDDPAIRRLEKISRDDPSEDVREEAEEVIEDLSDD